MSVDIFCLWKIIGLFARRDTLQGTNISPKNGTFEDDFPFPQVGYVNSLEGIFCFHVLKERGSKKATANFS